MPEKPPSLREGDQELLSALESGAVDFAGSFTPSQDVVSPTPALVAGDWKCIECGYAHDEAVEPVITVVLDADRRALFCSALCAEARGFMVCAQVWRASVDQNLGWAVVVDRNGRRLYPGEGTIRPSLMRSTA